MIKRLKLNVNMVMEHVILFVRDGRVFFATLKLC